VVTVSIEVFGEKAVERKLLRYGEAADMRFFAPEIRQYLFQTEREQFDSEGVSGSGGWAPLKPRTIARKAALGLDSRILRETQALFRSVTEASSPDAVYHADADSMVFGTSDRKAIFHQKGTDRMPRRKVVDLTERNRRAVVKIVQAGIMARAK
jgi:hypothetical protein